MSASDIRRVNSPAERALPFAARLQTLRAARVTRTGRHRHSKHPASVSVSTVSLCPPPASEIRVSQTL